MENVYEQLRTENVYKLQEYNKKLIERLYEQAILNNLEKFTEVSHLQTAWEKLVVEFENRGSGSIRYRILSEFLIANLKDSYRDFYEKLITVKRVLNLSNIFSFFSSLLVAKF